MSYIPVKMVVVDQLKRSMGSICFLIASIALHSFLVQVYHENCKRTLFQVLLFKNSDVCRTFHHVSSGIELFYENLARQWLTLLKN